ncbi:MAG: MazG family protein [Clostridia bacterium]|nr:MazG family protein [Clostridia bacterium]
MVRYDYVPEDGKYKFSDLYEIIRLLRSPGGCPWDRVQTHRTLTTPMVEEAYELVDAIEKENDAKMVEELGDVLLQVIFHCIIAEEDGKFGFDDVTDACARKMLFRHTHVFGEDVAASAAEALENWDRRKTKEKGFDSLERKLSDIPMNYPALYKAFKAASKIRKARAEAEKSGEPDPVTGKIADSEKKAAEAAPAIPESEEELGILLYGIVRSAEEAELNPETALRKFVDREIINENR